MELFGPETLDPKSSPFTPAPVLPLWELLYRVNTSNPQQCLGALASITSSLKLYVSSVFGRLNQIDLLFFLYNTIPKRDYVILLYTVDYSSPNYHTASVRNPEPIQFTNRLEELGRWISH